MSLSARKLFQVSLSAALCLGLFGAPTRSSADDEYQVLINGIQLGAKPTLVGEQPYYPGDELAKGFGASLQTSPAGCTLNGLPVKTPPVMIGGRPYLTLDCAAKTLGGTVLRDPVRHKIIVTCSAQATGGIPYYSKDYKTPSQQADEERQQGLRDAGLGGSVWLEKKHDELEAMYPKSVAVLDRVPTPIDFQMPGDPTNNKNAADPYTTQDGQIKPKGQVGMIQPNGYLQRVCENGTYKVSVSDVKISEALRGISPDLVAPPGTKYVVVTLIEENQSKGPQPTAWFALRDEGGNQYQGDYSLSQFSRAQLRSHETTSGFIIFQVPAGSQPSALVIMCNPPLSISLVL